MRNKENKGLKDNGGNNNNGKESLELFRTLRNENKYIIHTLKFGNS